MSNAINWTILCIITCTESSSVASRLGPDSSQATPKCWGPGAPFISVHTTPHAHGSWAHPSVKWGQPQHPAHRLFVRTKALGVNYQAQRKVFKGFALNAGSYLLALCSEQLASYLLVSFSSSIKWDNNSTKAWRSHCWLNTILAQCLTHGHFPLHESYYIANNWHILRKRLSNLPGVV